MSLSEYIQGMVQKLQEPLGLTGWAIHCQHGPLDGAKASCECEPEYKRITLSFDLEKLETGDELDEIIVHEMMHVHTWPSWEIGEDYANLVADMAPKTMQEPLRAALVEQIRHHGEDVTTQVGFTAIRLLRRLWRAEEEVNELKKAAKNLRKAQKAYMADRGNDKLGAAVAEAAQQMDKVLAGS